MGRKVGATLPFEMDGDQFTLVAHKKATVHCSMFSQLNKTVNCTVGSNARNLFEN